MAWDCMCSWWTEFLYNRYVSYIAIAEHSLAGSEEERGQLVELDDYQQANVQVT